MRRFHRILHLTDFSAVARTVFGTAVMLAKAQRAELLLLHVLPPPTMFFGGRRTSLATQFAAGVRGAAHRRLSLLLAEAKQSKLRARAFLVEGDPHREIIRAARSRGVDLIVMGTHGRTGASRLFLGSVAERVARLARCPVLVVPPR